ncbi:N-acetylmuramoyl-L-alanine amidase [Methylophilus sp. UBA6697]|jgi:N-acetylmuramoyl-L-alanine amidase|uniref:N-acetylmuramoyl-L-alanine amidase n=1 Tax=Methylophilus sp. UBA6697 TaxID=1946902 RepID=UPI000ED56F59|nr:N-acetylmuramoyl-L-alanine amidase [Methylophilus sp. UBA6697]HCU84576.1 N-acetylmuramoyl-L-alanine amidase [Methylophilus sp.]
MRKILTLWLLTAVCSLIGVARAAEVILANLQQHGSQVQVELLLDQQVKYRVFTLDNPFRVVIDMDAVAISPTLKALPFQLDAQHPYLSKIRIAPFTEHTTRLVFDIKSDIKPLVTDMNAGSSQQRLAISIAPATGSAEPAVATPALTPSKQLQEVPPANTDEKLAESTPPPSAVKEPASEAPAATANSEKPADKPVAADKPKQAKPGQKLITIAVDAGHGGEDPGARGANGSHEKNITLAIARKLKQQIDAEDNMQAILIRDGDYFVPLGDRVKKARAAKADLFISIHADSFVNSTAKGSSVFALSERGATSAGARYLAKKENAVDLIGGVSLDTRDMDLARTLLDLSQTATIHDSIRMGKAVLGRIAKINTLHSKYVEQAAFAVLKSPDIPSILVETAFISNPDEESRLNDDGYQDKLVNAILSGVKSYVATNPSFAKK